MAQPSYNELQTFLAVARDRSFTRGYHLYYPSGRQHTPAFSALLEALRYRNGRFPQLLFDNPAISSPLNRA